VLALDLELELGGRATGEKSARVRKAHRPQSVDLVEKPLVVYAMLEAQDLPEPVWDRWAGDPEQVDSVELALEALSGRDRELSVVVYHFTGHRVDTYKAFEGHLDLDEGDQVVELTPELAETWVLEGSLVGLDGREVDGVAMEDVQTRARFPATEVVQERDSTGFVFEDVPVGRFFYLRLHTPEGWSEPLYFCPLYFGQQANIQRVIDLADESC
jgi:hypothetical protein